MDGSRVLRCRCHRMPALGGGAAAEEDADDALVVRVGEGSPPLMLEVWEGKGYREYDEEKADGKWDVYWKGCRFCASEYKQATPQQRINHFQKTSEITKKDALLRNLRRMKAIHGAVYAFSPETYILPTEWTTLVRRVESMPVAERPIWILKPTDSSQGRKIFIIRDLAEISYGHFSASMLSDERPASDPDRDPKLDDKGRAIATELDMSTTLKMLKSRLNKTVTPCVKFTEMHVVQRYIERPLCFRGFKLDLRIYVLLLSAQPLRVYWFCDGLVRFATQTYNLANLDNSYAHLTNCSINKHSIVGAAGCKCPDGL